MEIVHKLVYNGVTTVIDEPIGFDDFKVTFKRHEYHGISAEVSVGDLEFYGAAATIIRNAYEADIDNEVKYLVLSSGQTIYSGVVDLSTFQESMGDYYSVSCKVGEIGAKTTFNNRLTSTVDLNTTQSVGGTYIGRAAWEQLAIPQKQLVHTNVATQKKPWTPFQGIRQISSSGLQSTCMIYIDSTKKCEFGSISNDPEGTDAFYSVGDSEAINDFREEYGTGCIATISGTIYAQMDIVATLKAGVSQSYIQVGVDSNANLTRLPVSGGQQVFNNLQMVISKSASAESDYTPELYVQVDWNEIDSIYYSISIDRGSTVTMKMTDTVVITDGRTPSMLTAYNALSHLVKVLSDNNLYVISDWYFGSRSSNVYGGGALKYITNGYKIRGIYDQTRSMNMTFKDMIESLNALDCVGWGFVGENTVRVEPWSWFYDNSVVVVLENVAEVKKEVDTSAIITGATFGYKKYDTDSDYYSIDSIHGERTYATGMKAIANEKSILCGFIADNYAIEETRRAANNIDASESFKYDDNVFVFEAAAGQNMATEIKSTAYDVTGVERPSELINAMLSPRQCAERWKSYLCATRSAKNFKYKAGKLNCDATFKVLQNDSTHRYLNSGLVECDEKSDVQYLHACFDAEMVMVECPITRAQYADIKTNPIGLVSVNNELYWIKEFTYSFADGMASMKLTPKHTN